MSFANKLLFACASAGAIMAAASAASAQADSAQIEEVVVTARRVQESQQDVPVAVTALSANEMRRQNITTIRDMVSQAPSLYITSGNGGASAANVSIRGQTQADVLLVTDPSVAVYMNGVNLPRQVGLRFAMYDLAGVEVLKGPQGTLFGKNTTGGALLLTTKAPSTTEAGGYIDVTGGNYHLYAVTAAANYPTSTTSSACASPPTRPSATDMARTPLARIYRTRTKRASARACCGRPPTPSASMSPPTTPGPARLGKPRA
jgi:iron complex outermembrane receptor protein